MKRFAYTTLFCLICFAAQAKQGLSIFDRLTAQKYHELTLTFDFTDLEANRKTVDEIPAVANIEGMELGLDLSVRGRFRRRTCTMPPLKLQFNKDELRDLGLNTHNDYKLVTHCTDDEAGQTALLREHLAYQLYSTINPGASFRTQLLTVTYVDSRDESYHTSYAILIEDTDELKDRLGTKNCSDCYNMPYEQFDNAETVALFQYMIGNADFSLTLGRNLKLMQNEEGRTTVVPYDFDYSGFVDPCYAKPCHPGQEAVTDRVFNWEFGEEHGNWGGAIDQFLTLEEELTLQVENYPHLDKKNKRELGRYLKDFFKELESGDFAH